jgi:hypothetical protein
MGAADKAPWRCTRSSSPVGARVPGLGRADAGLRVGGLHRACGRADLLPQRTARCPGAVPCRDCVGRDVQRHPPYSSRRPSACASSCYRGVEIYALATLGAVAGRACVDHFLTRVGRQGRGILGLPVLLRPPRRSPWCWQRAGETQLPRWTAAVRYGCGRRRGSGDGHPQLNHLLPKLE